MTPSLQAEHINATTRSKDREYITPSHKDIIESESESDSSAAEELGQQQQGATELGQQQQLMKSSSGQGDDASITHTHTLSGVYLTPHAKKSLLKYKYHSCDASFASYHLQGFWEWCVKLLPMWMAPNLVTVIGFVGICVNMAVLLIMAPHFDTDLPRWAYFMAAFATFAYQTLDAIDGKQARRTGASSPLGEMFDHCVDALVTLFHAITFLICIRFGTGWYSYLFIVMTFVAAYLCIWENYYTDEMRFGYWNSPTEALLTSILALAFHGVIGTAAFWKWNVLDLLPGVTREALRQWIEVGLASKYDWALKLYAIIDTMTLNRLFFIFGSFLALSNAIPSIMVVYKNAQHNTRRGYFSGAVIALLPFLFITGFFTVFLYFTPTKDSLLTEHIIGVLFAYGLPCSYIQSRLVVARICDEQAILFPFIMYPLPFMALHQYFGWHFVGSAHLLYAYLIYVVLVYVHFAAFTIHEICEHLGIQAFRLDYLKKRHE